MSDSLHSLLSEVRAYNGISHKSDIQQVSRALRQAWPITGHPNGDDCAVLASGDSYTLLAIEGFITHFVEYDPWFAGWCGVMVNLSDIAAMGGRPLAVVNALWSTDKAVAERLLEGMAAASRTYQVPIAGGHTNLRNNQQQLAVAVLGQAKRLLSSFAARAGMTLMIAVDLRGRWRQPGFNWDAATAAEPSLLRTAMNLLPMLAEQELVRAAKDISQAGVLGTLVMLLESAESGAEINLEAIPKPEGCPWQQWLCAFPSYGYLLAVEPEQQERVRSLFSEVGIDCASIGSLTDSRQLWVNQLSQRACFWDLNAEPLTGMNRGANQFDPDVPHPVP